MQRFRPRLAVLVVSVFVLFPALAHADDDDDDEKAEEVPKGPDTKQTPYRYAFTVEQGAFAGLASETIVSPDCASSWGSCHGDESSPTSTTRSVSAVGQGLSVGGYLQLGDGVTGIARVGYGSVHASIHNHNGLLVTGTGAGTYGYLSMEGPRLGVTGGFSYGNPLNRSSEIPPFGYQFRLRIGGGNLTRADMPDDPKARHGAFQIGFGTYHPEQVALGRQFRIGWLYRRWGGEIDLALATQDLGGVETIAVDAAFVIPAVVRPGLTLEVPFGFAAGTTLPGDATSLTFHAGLRFRMGQ